MWVQDFEEPPSEGDIDIPAEVEEPRFLIASESSILETRLQKKQKGKITISKEKEIIQVGTEASPTSKGRSEVNVLAKDFPYPQFMDNELMSLACLEQLKGDEDDLVDKLQWASHMLLRYSESIVASRV